MQTEPSCRTATTIEIPGEFIAIYDHDRGITGFTFMPSASYAGYFGPAATVRDGDEELDVESTGGPFWVAVQQALFEKNPMSVRWEE